MKRYESDLQQLDIMIEEWRAIKGYEGYYEVSSHGSVRSLIRTVQTKNGKMLKLKGIVMSPADDGKGYYCVLLSKNGRKKTRKIHRLVAETFLPNPDNKEFINHKDENRKNNSVENLEWCTRVYNNTYGNACAKKCETLKRNGHYKKVGMYTIDGVLLNIYESTKAAVRATGYNVSGIVGCLHNKKDHQTVHGYKFKYIQ